MKTLLKTVGMVSVVCGLAAGIHAVAAHHSTTMFDPSKSFTIKGKVTEVRWVNPHASISIDGLVNDETTSDVWTMEMTSPGNLTRQVGWSRTSVKVGDDVVVDFAPLRSGNHGGNLKKLTLVATGQVFTGSFKDQERPGLE